MQIKVSLFTATILLATFAHAEDYVTTQLMFYDEDHEVTNIISPIVAPSLEVNLDYGANYTFNGKITVDAVSGASPTFYDKSFDTSSGASPYRHSTSMPSPFARGEEVSAGEIGYGLINYAETRIFGAAALTKRLEESRDEMTFGLSYSNEHDYHIPEASFSYLHWLDDSKNSSLEGSVSYQRGDVLLWCSGNRECDASSGASAITHQSISNMQISYATVIDTKSQAKISLFGAKEMGYLTNQYLNVVRNKGGRLYIENEQRPDRKTAYGVRLDYARSLNDKWTMQTNYRYYHDDWDINSHTIEGELYYSYNDKLSFEGALRYYTQSSAEFYSSESDYFTTQKYASSDLRLGELSSMNYLVGLDYKSSSKFSYYVMVDYYRQDKDTQAIAVIAGQKYSF